MYIYFIYVYTAYKTACANVKAAFSTKVSYTSIFTTPPSLGQIIIMKFSLPVLLNLNVVVVVLVFFLGCFIER